ncbi:MAG: DNA polymerase III subunit beta [Epulopiscium sp.]|nr:DNA polymerase III subunit beta [Candidatus Epulonipiscium sp.]
MKIICNKSSLLNGVNTVLKAVSSRTTLPILECILLEADENNFKLISTDLELGIESQVDATVIKPGSIALESKIFSEIVRKLPDSTVEISVDENNMTTIICEKSQFKIAGQSGSEFPPLPEVEKNNQFSLSQTVLKDMIRQTIFSVAVEETRQILTGELIEIKNQSLHMVSVDGYRVSFRKTDLSIENELVEVVVPGKTLNEISKILSTEDEDKVSLYFTDKHVLFDLGTSIVVSRLLEGEFLKYEQIFSADYETKIVVDRRELLMSIERAALISRENKKNPVKVEIKQEQLVITSNTELGTAYEEIQIQMEGKDLVIAFNPRYVIDALRAIEDEKICIQFTSSLSPCIIQPIEGEDYKYLILPIRLNA